MQILNSTKQKINRLIKRQILQFCELWWTQSIQTETDNIMSMDDISMVMLVTVSVYYYLSGLMFSYMCTLICLYTLCSPPQTKTPHAAFPPPVPLIPNDKNRKVKSSKSEVK